ncbi:hypothetical protein F5148DRAFT_792808 [Russula earlei]|uniref:Uncharacterized protein n=1 Tax=Russula earlei TaxID=71964 RepID=A0ACC0UP81_9AGAM|nr:hypothetical protein F5148DRAFT_792808 [Russula earlei]
MSSPNPSSQVSPSTTTTPSSQPSSPNELRHIISSGALTPQRECVRERKLSAHHSQHLGLRVGSRSPTSIPSSPTSVHSSSSAIFERDIEPITPSPPHPSHPHRTPRGKATEQLDHAVPTVLDSAATVLSSPTDDQLIAVVAPATSDPSPTYGRTNVPFMNLPSPSPSLTLPLPAHPGLYTTSQKFNIQTPPAAHNADAIGAPSPTPTASYFAGSVSQETTTDAHPTPTTVVPLGPPTTFFTFREACISPRPFSSSFSACRYQTTFVHIVYRLAHLSAFIHTPPFDSYHLRNRLRSSPPSFVRVGHSPTRQWRNC